MDEEVLQGQRETLGDEHLHTLQTRSSLAADLRALGDYQAALELDLETYESWSSGYGEEYRGTLSAAHNLALSYLLTGDFRQALAQDRLTLERRAAVLGPCTRGRSTPARPSRATCWKRAATRKQSPGWRTSGRSAADTLGDDDRITLNARLLLGVALRCAGHPEQAAEPHRCRQDRPDPRVRRGQQRRPGMPPEPGAEPAGPGPGSGGQERQRRVSWLSMRGELGSEHPHSLICQLNIATALCLEGEYPAAETAAQSAVDGLQNGSARLIPIRWPRRWSWLARAGHPGEPGRGRGTGESGHRRAGASPRRRSTQIPCAAVRTCC